MLGDKIKEHRLRKQLSLSEVSKRSGIAKSYLSSIERDIQTNPSIQFLEKIAPILDTTVEELLFDKKTVDETLDDEWLNIVREAMASNVDKQQFREFLEFHKWRNHNDNNQ